MYPVFCSSFFYNIFSPSTSDYKLFNIMSDYKLFCNVIVKRQWRRDQERNWIGLDAATVIHRGRWTWRNRPERNGRYAIVAVTKEKGQGRPKLTYRPSYGFLFAAWLFRGYLITWPAHYIFHFLDGYLFSKKFRISFKFFKQIWEH